MEENKKYSRTKIKKAINKILKNSGPRGVIKRWWKNVEDQGNIDKLFKTHSYKIRRTLLFNGYHCFLFSSTPEEFSYWARIRSDASELPDDYYIIK